jgi:hypothetical protein
VTLALLAGLALFALATFLYCLPVLLETPPPGAIPDYTAERVRAHLAGKVHWLLAGSYLVVAFVLSRRARRP